jgi:hypothetical protein
MATTIVDQVIEYDNSARAWAQLRTDDSMVELIKYHDSEQDAIYAALPADLQDWVDTRRLDGDGGARALRAAAIIANGQIKPDSQAYGIYHVPYRREQNGMTYEGAHIVNARARTCTCEDRRYRSAWCKHLLAARYLFEQWQAEHMPRRPTLWDLARATFDERQEERDAWPENEPTVIWQDASGTRQVTLTRIKDYLYLSISGYGRPLPIAHLHRYHVVLDPAQATEWTWTLKKWEYQGWVEAIQKS